MDGLSFGDSALSLLGIGSGSHFASGESAGIPTFDFGSSTANNTASGGYSLCQAMGGSADTCGLFASHAGVALGQMTSQQGVDAYNAAQPANALDSAIYGGGAGNAYVKGSAAYYKNGWLCRLGMSGCDQAAYKKATDNGMVSGASFASWLTDPTRLTVLVIGIILFGAALFMLKSPINIVSAAKGAVTGS